MAFGNETEYRAKARNLISRTGHGCTGGHFLKGGRAGDDYAQDKRMVDRQISRAISEHDTQLHPGHSTRLKLADGGMAMGGPSMMRADRPKRGGAGKKAAHTNVNVIVASKPSGGAPPPMPMPMPHPVPPAMGMAGPPPMPPPGAGGPPPGGPGGPVGGLPPKPPLPLPAGPQGLMPGMPPGGMPMRKSGGRTGKDPAIAKEAREEGESYKEEWKEEHPRRASGGRAENTPPTMLSGSLSGRGRLEKIAGLD